MSTIRLRSHKKLNPAQARAWKSESRWTAFLGGWGSGKTWCGARAFLRNLARNPPGVDSLIVAPFWSTVYRTTLREFLRVVPRELVSGVSRKEHYVEVLGRRVYYGSADKPETLDGPTVGAAWVDEGRYLSREAWRIVLTRLRDVRAPSPRGFITSTPGGEWLEEEFATGKPNRCAVHGSTRENAHNLAEGTVEDIEQSLSARAAKVYIDGQFGLLEGAVYDFDKACHCIPWRYNPGLPVVAVWDFGYHMPAVLFLQPIPPGTAIPPAVGTVVPRKALPGTWIVIDEMVPEELTTEQLAHQVRAKGYRIQSLYCDPAGDGTQTATGLTDVKVLKEVLQVQPRWVEAPHLRYIPVGVRMVQALLRNVRNETRLYVAAHLEKPKARRGVVKDFGAYRYPDRKDGRPVDEKPLKDGVHDHAMDAVRYWALNEMVRSGRALEPIPIV